MPIDQEIVFLEARSLDTSLRVSGGSRRVVKVDDTYTGVETVFSRRGGFSR